MCAVCTVALALLGLARPVWSAPPPKNQPSNLFAPYSSSAAQPATREAAPTTLAMSDSLSGLPPESFTLPESRPPSQHQWGPTTSGPFFTGTAEVEPMGSSYWEPYLFDYKKDGSRSMNFNQKSAMGLGHNLEFDAQVPLILNTAANPASATGSSVSQFGPGDAHLDFKYQLTDDQNTHKLLAWPALALTTDFFLPSGNASGLRPSRYGVDQFGNGTFQEGMSLLIRKRFEPFSFYGQIGDLVEDPTNVAQGYGYDNNIGTVPSGSHVRMVDGNLLYYSAALEYVLNSRRGIGFLTEFDGQSQSLHNLFFGKATAPSYSYLSAAPEVEYTWPAGKRFALTWGAGVNLPIERGDYPRIVTPMMTLTFNFFGPNGSRNSE
ncbi:MAG: hypothetical protein ACLGPM_11155 [Acidobacteriota bacterium]